LARFSKPKPHPSLRILCCHYVFDDQIAAFDAQIQYLLTIGSFITISDVIDILNGVKALDKHYFHISFDDGFRNIITNAWPVLRNYNVPATFFIPTAIISGDDEVVRHFCLNRANYPDVIDIAKWNDLAIAQEQGLTIASHTRTHARFCEISHSVAKLEEEIRGSKAEIEKHLGQPCNYIAWPFGRLSDVDKASLEFVKRAGYRACFGAFRGCVEPRKTNPFCIPRHHIEPHWPLGHVKFFTQGGMEGKAWKAKR
jgi:peptidoglycan/xylan/chitin deacetylase (PgdA/CDA1 family)